MKKKALSIGLTGGIGSGKTTVAKIFEAFNIPVYYADDRAKLLMNEDEQLMSQLIEEFGEELYAGGSLNRAWLAQQIFNNDAARGKVNALVHPAVGRDFSEWLEACDAPYALKEAAILFETNGYLQNDANILVTAPENIRTNRVMERDSATADQVKARMNAQWPDEKKEGLADFVVINDGNHPLIPQVQSIHEALLIRANS